MDFNNIPYYKKTPEQEQEIISLLNKSFLTKNLSSSEVEKLAGAMKPRVFQKDDYIIKYGDVGNEYFILAQGDVQVIVYQKDTSPTDPQLSEKVQFTKVMSKGAGFGELALLYNDKRSASIKANEQCTTYVLDGNVFKTIIIKSSIDKRNIKSGFLDNIKLLNSLDKNQKVKLTEGLKTLYLKKDDFVLKEGDEGNEFFIIEEGSVECLKLENVGDKKGFFNVRSLGAGDHFGELALINKEKRSLSIRVQSDQGCKLLSLDKDSFERVLGSIQNHLKKDYTD